MKNTAAENLSNKLNKGISPMEHEVRGKKLGWKLLFETATSRVFARKVRGSKNDWFGHTHNNRPSDDPQRGQDFLVLDKQD